MDNLSWGLQITVLGMGLVFGLLALLWGLLTLVQRLDREPAGGVRRPQAPAHDPAAAAGAGVPVGSARQRAMASTPNWWPRSWRPRWRTARCAGAKPRR